MLPFPIGRSINTGGRPPSYEVAKALENDVPKSTHNIMSFGTSSSSIGCEFSLILG